MVSIVHSRYWGAHPYVVGESPPYVVGEATQNQDDLIEKNLTEYKNQSVTDSISNINKGNSTNILDVDSETDKKEEDSKDEKEVKTKTISSDLA